jgi:hypothetical protein
MRETMIRAIAMPMMGCPKITPKEVQRTNRAMGLLLIERKYNSFFMLLKGYQIVME